MGQIPRSTERISSIEIGSYLRNTEQKKSWHVLFIEIQCTCCWLSLCWLVSNSAINLSGKIRHYNDLLCVRWNVNLCSLTHRSPITGTLFFPRTNFMLYYSFSTVLLFSYRKICCINCCFFLFSLLIVLLFNKRTTSARGWSEVQAVIRWDGWRE